MPSEFKHPWFVYILECNDGSLYTGITDDLKKRFEKHQSGKGAKYTRARGAKKIVYSEKCSGRKTAAVREAQIKKLPRALKLKLTQNFIKDILPT